MTNVSDFFLGCSSPHGFFGFWKELQGEDGPRLYLIKSGPGCGKSTLMKELARRADGPVQQIHCSSDPDSLDGVYFEKQNAMVLDATAPHAMDPACPGAGEQVVSLYDTLDAPLLQSREAEIRALFARCSRLQAQAARYYGAAGGFLLENQRTAACLTDYPKVRAFAQRTADRCLPKGEGKGKEQLRLLSALTPKGVLTYRESIPALARQVWVLEDEYGTASRVILDTLRRLALERGHDLITCRCAAFEGKIDHLILPGLGLAFVTSNSWHPMAGQKNIHCSRFLSREGMRAQARRMRFVKKAAADMLAQGAALQAQALDTHNELEVFYRQAVDFALVEARGQALARQLGL